MVIYRVENVDCFNYSSPSFVTFILPNAVEISPSAIMLKILLKTNEEFFFQNWFLLEERKKYITLYDNYYVKKRWI